MLTVTECSGRSFDLLNRAAFDAPGGARAAWDEWCGSHSLDALDPTSSLMLSEIQANLMSDGFSGAIAERARLEGVTRHWRVRRHLLLHAADQLSETLHRCGRTNALTGGVAIDALVYAPDHVRPGYEVAVFVKNDSIRALLRAIAEEGWRTPGADRGCVGLDLASEATVERDNAKVTLRWNLLPGERQTLLDETELQHTVLRDGRAIVRGEALLLALLADPRARHHAPLLWEADIRRLTKLPGLDLAAVAAMAQSRSASRVLAYSLEHLRARGVGPLPEDLVGSATPNLRCRNFAFDFRTRNQRPVNGRSQVLAMTTMRRGSSFLAVTRELPVQERAKLMARILRREIARLPDRSDVVNQ